MEREGKGPPVSGDRDREVPTIVDRNATFHGEPMDGEELAKSLARYKMGDMLGRGGMGEVVSARDEQIGRDVAIKRLRDGTPTRVQQALFLREARIQGRLGHPAVVPVHELRRDARGQPFFVMRQLEGITLSEVIKKLAAGDRDAEQRYPRQRLLRAFAEVCLAIEFAHTRGVVHRDLKPANIVLGDFGEVYVLDWGVAHVMDKEAKTADFEDVQTIDDSLRVDGMILGSPGYMSPEQIRADPELDGRSDVYALGCILFEILALKSLHETGLAGIALGGAHRWPSSS
jgi:eukaryotic-like serine/threonine-protein kinase